VLFLSCLENCVSRPRIASFTRDVVFIFVLLLPRLAHAPQGGQHAPGSGRHAGRRRRARYLGHRPLRFRPVLVVVQQGRLADSRRGFGQTFNCTFSSVFSFLIIYLKPVSFPVVFTGGSKEPPSGFKALSKQDRN